jgi:hypothetical protein
MPHSIGRLSASASSHHSLSSAAFITNIAESDFRHAQVSAAGRGRDSIDFGSRSLGLPNPFLAAPGLDVLDEE